MVNVRTMTNAVTEAFMTAFVMAAAMTVSGDSPSVPLDGYLYLTEGASR